MNHILIFSIKFFSIHELFHEPQITNTNII